MRDQGVACAVESCDWQGCKFNAHIQSGLYRDPEFGAEPTSISGSLSSFAAPGSCAPIYRAWKLISIAFNCQVLQFVILCTYFCYSQVGEELHHVGRGLDPRCCKRECLGSVHDSVVSHGRISVVRRRAAAARAAAARDALPLLTDVGIDGDSDGEGGLGATHE